MTLPPLPKAIYDWLEAGPRAWADLRRAFPDKGTERLEAGLKHLRDTGLIKYWPDARGLTCYTRVDQMVLHAAEAKPCPRCEEVKPIEAFTLDANRRDGHSPYCRACQGALRMKRTIRKKQLQLGYAARRVAELEKMDG